MKAVQDTLEEDLLRELAADERVRRRDRHVAARSGTGAIAIRQVTVLRDWRCGVASRMRHPQIGGRRARTGMHEPATGRAG